MQKPYLRVRRGLIGLCCLLIATAGVAYAAFMSNDVQIPHNTIGTASAHLELSGDGEHFSRQLDGYEFTNLVPGAEPSGERQIFLRNTGSTRLHLSLLLTQPVVTQGGAGHLNLHDVHVGLTPGGTADLLSYSFESFADGQPKLFGPVLEPGQMTALTLQAWIGEGALTDTTEQVVLEDFSMIFGGSPEVV